MQSVFDKENSIHSLWMNGPIFMMIENSSLFFICNPFHFSMCHIYTKITTKVQGHIDDSIHFDELRMFNNFESSFSHTCGTNLIIVSSN